jgi:hypothetical protein
MKLFRRRMVGLALNEKGCRNTVMGRSKRHMALARERKDCRGPYVYSMQEGNVGNPPAKPGFPRGAAATVF